MQSFPISLYLYIVKTMRHLLLLALFCCAVVIHAETYAVIISGGRNKMFNHERYWNDCAFLYRTLRQEYHISKDHIFLLMADGDNPANDMLCDDATGFASSPTDLDVDGQSDLTLAATRKNLDDTFYQLSSLLTANDHIFIFITDHGERDAYGSVHLWLWGNEQLSPNELSTIIGQCHPSTMNILLGQCHAGAFIAPLQADGRVIIAACAADQMSWACKDKAYDEFVYHWTCAIARHDETGQPIDADSDGNGLISMDEAFSYACQHDCRPETPTLTSQPSDLSARWSFSGVEEKVGITQTFTLFPSTSTLFDLQGRKIKND